MLIRKYSAIALDVGTVRVSACQLAQTRAGPILRQWAVSQDPLRERPPIVSGAVQKESVIAQRAARMIRQAGFRGCDVLLGLNPPDVGFVPLTIPGAMLAVNREELLRALSIQAAREMQADPTTLIVDYWKLPCVKRKSDKRDTENVMVAAASAQAVAAWSDFVESIGLNLRHVDVAPCALLRAIWSRDADPQATPHVWGVLDIGFSHSVLTLAIGPECVFVRELTLTGDALTIAVLTTLEVDYENAEMLKRQVSVAKMPGASPDQPHPSPAETAQGGVIVKTERRARAGNWGDVFSRRVGAVLRGRLKSLAQEIEHAFTYVMENYPDVSPAKTGLFLTGGTSLLDGFSDHLSELLGVDVEILDPTTNLAALPSAHCPTTANYPHLSTGVGLALGDLS